MQNTSSDNQFQQTLPIPSFIGNDPFSILKTNATRFFIERMGRGVPAAETNWWKRTLGAVSLARRNLKSRVCVDAYGQSRPLTETEIFFRALAWRTVVGAVLGFGLSISLLALHNTEVLKHAVALQEVTP